MRVATTEGEILYSGFDESEEGLGRHRNLLMFAPKIRYAYQFGESVFESESISMVKSRSTHRSDYERMLARFPKGRRVRVFVNVDNPGDSYLFDPRRHRLSCAALVLGFAALGAFMNWMIVVFVD